MSDPKNPVPGDQVIDASEFVFVDITPDRVRKLTKLREGYPEAVSEVLNLKPVDIDRAGLSQSDVAKLRVVSAESERAELFLAAVAKLGELLHEAVALHHHDIGILLAEFAAQASRRAGRVTNGDEVLGPVKKLLSYQYGPAHKALATKEKHKAEEADGQEDGSSPASPLSAPKVS